jgi:hypothetical protein
LAIPTSKTPEMDALIRDVLGVDRVKVIQSDKCGCCGGDAKEFRNDISRREYRISGLCQACQDSVFEKD